MNLKTALVLVIIFTVEDKTCTLATLLTKSTAQACLGEEVVFTCTVEGGSLSWSLTVTSNSDVPVLRHTFHYRDYDLTSKRVVWLQTGFCVELSLVSVESMLLSTLVANLTDAIVGAEVTCRQHFPVNQVLRGHFSLAGNVSIGMHFITYICMHWKYNFCDRCTHFTTNGNNGNWISVWMH